MPNTFPNNNIRNFYTIRDFFTWLKSPEHAPTSHPIAVVVPYTSENYPVPDIPITDFTNAFQLSIQNVSCPMYILESGSSVSMPNGNWESISNIYPNAR